jgi:hypothetical protein
MTHPDTDALAEFHAGLITGHRGARIADHLAECERCTALGAQLADVSALLAAIPAPAMPLGVANRLDAVLAAEVAEREKGNYSERARGDTSPEPRTPRRRSGNRGFRLVALRVLAPAAAVLAAGGYGLSLLGSGPATQSAASSSVGRAHTPVRAAPAAPAAPGIPGVASEQPRAKPAVKSPHSFTLHISHTNYQRGTLRQQLETELRTPGLARSTRTPPAQVVACVRLVTNGISPAYVESAYFHGQPVTVIVVSLSSGGKQAWVAGARCSAAVKDVLDSTALPPGI